MSLLLYVVRFFRRLVGPGLIICALFAPAAWALSTDTLIVTVDQARVVKVPAAARTLVIGNPMIADVTLLKQGGAMVVTGKGFGETNLIALDSDGNPVAESMVQVVSSGNALVVQRGMDRESYTCAPRCQPTARLGDDPKFYGDVTAQIQAHNAEATGH
jgi:hypothetical protein